ncbi:MAG TPA: hypothetical protein VJV78_17635 [Polyangiales bacterium]|nr:hypothetical protein [Polyangiales bacterium]
MLAAAGCSAQEPLAHAGDPAVANGVAANGSTRTAGSSGQAGSAGEPARDAGPVKVATDTRPRDAGQGAAGAAADGGGDDAGVTTEGVCPNTSMPFFPGAVKPCTRQEDCAGLLNGQAVCSAAPPPISGCGPVGPRVECPSLQECSAAEACVVDACGGSKCKPSCAVTGCGDTERCHGGICVPKRCDEAGAAPCPDRFKCDPTSSTMAEARGCRPVRCDQGAPCAQGWDCMPGSGQPSDAHGCKHRTCTKAADCDCGSCVVGFCEPFPGACFSNVRPP